ncbi:MAG: transglutaminase-like domain-containing protein [Candidatus Eremiobacteraeota bacterium]|nr:transglutaminase-like domain-containing protein [Candidatus Eremiobacteraeota bacterium]
MFIFAVVVCPLGASDIHRWDRTRKIRLIYGLAVTNKGDRPLGNITVRVPEIQDRPPYQSADVIAVRPGDFTRERSPRDVPLARFEIEKLAPGEKRTFLVQAEVAVSEVTYRLQEEKAHDPGASMRQFLSLDGDFTTKSPALREKCREFAREKNPLKRAKNIYLYIISGAFTFSNSPAGSGVDLSFRTKHLNCSDAASLYLVMCRLCGIPARYVGGIFYTSERKWYPLLHAWNEIYIPPFGWLPVDPTLGRISAKNRSLCFAHIRNRYIALWSDQPGAFSIESPSDADHLEFHHSVHAESL